MTWLGYFLLLWTGILTGVAVFVAVDARNAYDDDPATATLSGYIKAWRRARAYRTALLGACVCSLVIVPVYLFLHLVLERI